MPRSRFAYSLPKCQEQFSVAYIRSVSSVAGYKVVRVDEIDEDSVDIEIQQNQSEGNYPFYSILKVQAKCTYSIKPAGDSYLHFRLSAKNYDDLRAKTGIPFILVVLCIPGKDSLDWLAEKDDSMVLYNTAYWMSLWGKDALPPSDTPYNERKTTVYVPISQRFDVQGLIGLMDTLAEGRFPHENQNS